MFVKSVGMKSTIKQKSGSYSETLALLNGRAGFALLSFIAVCFLVVTLVRPSVFSGPRIGVVDVFMPVLSTISRPFQNMADAVSEVSGRATLKAENVKLKAENARLREWYQTALMLQAENQSLQKLLNLKVDANHKYVTTRVVSDAGNAFVKSLLISSGYESGIKKNQAVLAGEGMIGRVIEVGKSASRVLLLTDINSRVPVIIEGTNQKAILTGNNDGHLALSRMPKDSSTVEGARIITSGDGGIFPYGLPVGKVVSTENGEKAIQLFANMDRISYVRVVDVPINPNLVRGDLSSSID